MGKHLGVSMDLCSSSEPPVGKKSECRVEEYEDKSEPMKHFYISPFLYLITKQPSGVLTITLCVSWPTLTWNYTGKIPGNRFQRLTN